MHVKAPTSPFRGRAIARLCAVLSLFFVCGLVGPGTVALRAQGTASDAWTVVEASGAIDARLRSQSDWSPVAAGAQLTGPVSLRAGANGFGVVMRGEDRITLSANSEIDLPGTGSDGTGTRIIQPYGEAAYEVNHRPGWSFSVDTPYLAVIVKGTVFSIAIEESSTTVAVTEGTVQAKRSDGTAVDVTAGQSATTDAAPGSSIEVTTTATGDVRTTASTTPQADPVSAASSSAAPSSGTSLTGPTAEAAVSSGTTSVSADATLGSGSIGVSSDATVSESGTSVGVSVGAVGTSVGADVSPDSGALTVGVNADLGGGTTSGGGSGSSSGGSSSSGGGAGNIGGGSGSSGGVSSGGSSSGGSSGESSGSSEGSGGATSSSGGGSGGGGLGGALGGLRDKLGL